MSNSPLAHFLSTVPPERQADFQQLDAFIRQHAPKLEPYLEGKFLGYGRYHYRYATGREGDWFTIGLGNNKNSLAVYVVSTENGQYLAEQYKDRLQASIGKSCIRFKKIADIDWAVLGELIERAAAAYQPEQIAD